MNTILVTTGDLDGIGFEVFVKALKEKSFYKNSPIIFFFHPQQRLSSYFGDLESFGLKFLSSLTLCKNPGLYAFEHDGSVVDWVTEASQFCLRNPHSSVLVTGPLDKKTIALRGLPFLGHTEILAHECGVKKTDLLMFFLGSYFNILCLTGHIPLEDVTKTLSEPQWISKQLTLFLDWIYQKQKTLLPSSLEPFAVLGLNPHCGDQGLIGSFDEKILKPSLKTSYPLTLQGPLVPDSAFAGFPAQNLLYKTFISLYHDQGLIPFKMAHGFSGVHTTVGLPFLRVSVDHGTAKNIAFTNKADHRSMMDCLTLVCETNRNSCLSFEINQNKGK
jgi:4-hydroxy-L-threonine phosphate dehydrogenase PdxA